MLTRVAANVEIPAPGEELKALLARQEASYASRGDDLVIFFAIGMVINIALLVAFFVWAFRQWKRKR